MECATGSHLTCALEAAARMQRHDGAEGRVQARQRVAQRDIGPHRRPVRVAVQVSVEQAAGGEGWWDSPPTRMDNITIYMATMPLRITLSSECVVAMDSQ